MMRPPAHTGDGVDPTLTCQGIGLMRRAKTIGNVSSSTTVGWFRKPSENVRSVFQLSTNRDLAVLSILECD
jgi:hypothetical protein